MFVLAALLGLSAGTVELPAPVRAGPLLGLEDYPRGELEARRNGSVTFKVLVTPAGMPESCVIQRATFSEQDRKDFCAKIMTRFRYRPVKGPDGEPRYFLLEDTFVYYQPDEGRGDIPRSGPDFQFEVNALPGKSRGPVEVRVNVAVDPAGALTTCSVPKDIRDRQLAELACANLAPIWRARAEHNAAGEAIAYIRRVRAEFRANGSAM